MDEDILLILASSLIVLIPVAGITARIALKPMIDSIARILEARQASQEVRMLEQRLSLVEQELQHTRGEVRELSAQAEFYRRLAEPQAKL